MEKVKVTLPDSSVREFEKGISVYEAAKQISEGLANASICAEINGMPVDMSASVNCDCSLKLHTFSSEEGADTYRHTASHILAQAVKNLYPDTMLAIGPSIKNGFYYDFDLKSPLTNEDLVAIEQEMQRIIKANHLVKRSEISKADAEKILSQHGEKYKVEMLQAIPEGETVTLYTQGDFVELCRGPHLHSTGKVKAFKLTSIAGAYWRGDSKNKMLTRIYGTAFDKKSDLDAYLLMVEEAKKRDHRKLGRELDLFDIFEEGPGFPFFFPKGMTIRNLLEDFWRKEHIRFGYEEVKTPIILNEELWHRSGHWDHYKENMYFTKIDDGNYAVKPMNCPGGMLAFKRKLHSYRDLPVRTAELGLVHRHELSGALHGLMRVRCFTQDDAHIFMTPEQIDEEIKGVMKLIDDFYTTFGFTYKLELSTKPEKAMGSDEQWEMATNALKNALDASGKGYRINEGDGAFYGPKIDFHLQDSIGRTWQCGTIQLDFQMPEKFDLTYVGADGGKHRPVMIHRVVFGSIERFMAILTEHFAGAFPLWLAPVQLQVLPISQNSSKYAKKVFDKLQKLGFRVEFDDRNEKISYRIREAQLQKVPYMLVLGEREQQSKLVAVRDRKDGSTTNMTMGELVKMLKEKIDNKIF